MNRPNQTPADYLFWLGTMCVVLLLLLLLFAACDTVGHEPVAQKPSLELSDPWLTEFGDRGGVLAHVNAPRRTRLTVTFQKHEAVLDTSLQGRQSLDLRLPYTRAWGRPPGPHGDCYAATLHGVDSVRVCSPERAASYPSAKPASR